MLNYTPLIQSLLHLCPEADIRIARKTTDALQQDDPEAFTPTLVHPLDPDTDLQICVPPSAQSLLPAMESLAETYLLNVRKVNLPHVQSSAAHLLLDYLLRADTEEGLPNALLLAQQARIDLSARRYLCMMDCSGVMQPMQSQPDRFGLIRDRIQRAFPPDAPILFKEYNSRQLLFCIPCGSHPSAKAGIHARLVRIRQELEYDFGAACPIGVSFCILQPEEYKDAFAAAQAALQLSQRPHMDGIAFMEDHWLDYDISKIDSDVARGYLSPYIEALRADPQLLQTAQTLMRNEMNYAQAAAALYMHKNTFINHMRTLKEKLGLDPLRSDSDCILLKMALHFLTEETDEASGTGNG